MRTGNAGMKADAIVLHCSASQDGLKYDISRIDTDHRARGFSGGVGYHLVIQPDGEVQKGRPLNVGGAHVKGDNDHTIGICLIGSRRFSIEQFNTLRYQLDSIFGTYDIPKWRLMMHREFPSAIKQGKTCPNMLPCEVLHWYWTGTTDSIKPYLRERSARETG